MNVTSVLGVRLQIKSAPFIHLASKDKQVHLDIIRTGQHYDYETTKIFFEELHLPDPIVNLNVSSGTDAPQTAKIVLRLERILKIQKPNLVILPERHELYSSLSINNCKTHAYTKIHLVRGFCAFPLFC